MPTFASKRFRNHCRVRYSSRSLPLNDSSAPFCHGFPGSTLSEPTSILLPDVGRQSKPLFRKIGCYLPILMITAKDAVDGETAVLEFEGREYRWRKKTLGIA
jgi:hypothetical protein